MFLLFYSRSSCPNELAFMSFFLLIIVHGCYNEDYVLLFTFESTDMKVPAHTTIFFFFFFPILVFYRLLKYLDQVILYLFNLQCSDFVDYIDKKNRNAIVSNYSSCSFGLLPSMEAYLFYSSNNTVKKDVLFII